MIPHSVHHMVRKWAQPGASEWQQDMVILPKAEPGESEGDYTARCANYLQQTQPLPPGSTIITYISR